MPPDQRASDAEREAVADRLRAAAGDGRLDPDELEERVSAAYAARTRGELVPLTADLPATPVPEPPRRTSPVVREKLAGFLSANVICWAIWLATGASASAWPKWVTLFTAIALVLAVIRDRLGLYDDDT